MWILAHIILTSYNLCKQFGIPKCTGIEWTCSYCKAWWWPDRAETCHLVCTFNGNNRCVRWKYKYSVETLLAEKCFYSSERKNILLTLLGVELKYYFTATWICFQIVILFVSTWWFKRWCWLWQFVFFIRGVNGDFKIIN